MNKNRYTYLLILIFILGCSEEPIKPISFKELAENRRQCELVVLKDIFDRIFKSPKKSLEKTALFIDGPDSLENEIIEHYASKGKIILHSDRAIVSEQGAIRDKLNPLIGGYIYSIDSVTFDKKEAIVSVGFFSTPTGAVYWEYILKLEDGMWLILSKRTTFAS